MNKEFLKAIRISLIFISIGLLTSCCIFFLLFGNGLQFILPFILFSIFFIFVFIAEKIRFLSSHRVIKWILYLIVTALVFIIL